MNLFSKVIQTFSSKVIITFITFVLSVLVVKLVGAEGQGLITLFYTLFLFFSTFFMLSLGSGTIFHVNKYNKATQYLSNFFFSSVLITIFVLLLFFVFQERIITNFLNNSAENFFHLGFCLLVVFNLSKISSTLSRSLHNSLAFNGSVLLEKVFYFFIVFSFFVMDIKVGFQDIVFAFILSSLLVNIFVIFYFRNYIKLKLIDKEKIKNLLNFSLKGHLGVVVQKLNLKFDVFYLAYIFSAETLGYYSISIYFSQILLYIPDSISVFLYPQLSRKTDKNSALETTLTINRILFALLIIISIIISILAKDLIIYLYGKNFVVSYTPLLLLLIGSIFFASVKIFTKLSTSLGFPLVGTKISIIGIITNIPLLIFLVPEYSIIGAALASLISYFVMYISILIWLFKKFSFIRISDVLLLKKSDIKLCISAYSKIKTKIF